MLEAMVKVNWNGPDFGYCYCERPTVHLFRCRKISIQVIPILRRQLALPRSGIATGYHVRLGVIYAIVSCAGAFSSILSNASSPHTCSEIVRISAHSAPRHWSAPDGILKTSKSDDPRGVLLSPLCPTTTAGT